MYDHTVCSAGHNLDVACVLCHSPLYEPPITDTWPVGQEGQVQSRLFRAADIPQTPFAATISKLSHQLINTNDGTRSMCCRKIVSYSSYFWSGKSACRINPGAVTFSQIDQWNIKSIHFAAHIGEIATYRTPISAATVS